MKTIFFDNDGTLVDTETIYFEATKAILKEVDIDMSKEWFIDFVLRKNCSSWKLLEGRGFSDKEVEFLKKKRNNYYAKLLKKDVQLLPEVLETLEKLYGKVKMGVVTSSRKQHFEIILEKTGIARFFEFFVVNEDVKNEKPNPEPYLLALKRSGSKPSECLAIEDTEKGVLSAKGAGIACYAVPTKLSTSHDFSSSDGVLSSFREVLQLI